MCSETKRKVHPVGRLVFFAFSSESVSTSQSAPGYQTAVNHSKLTFSLPCALRFLSFSSRSYLPTNASELNSSTVWNWEHDGRERRPGSKRWTKATEYSSQSSNASTLSSNRSAVIRGASGSVMTPASVTCDTARHSVTRPYLI